MRTRKPIRWACNSAACRLSTQVTLNRRKRMRKTRLTAFLAVLLLALVSTVAVGCGGGSDTTGSSSSGEGGGEPLTVGSDIPYPPFEQGKSGEYTGFDIELMEAIGEKIGRSPEFQDTSFETIFRDVAQGKFEAVISAATIT